MCGMCYPKGVEPDWDKRVLDLLYDASEMLTAAHVENCSGYALGTDDVPCFLCDGAEILHDVCERVMLGVRVLRGVDSAK